MKIYIEAGANDGVFQSNTLSLENTNEWKGILIEPNKASFDECVKNRSAANNWFFNCALVPLNYEHENITLFMHEGHSAMAGVLKRIDTNYSGECKVKTRTLQSILDELDITTVDKMFLDVEGYELEVLKGICFKTTKFNEIEVEVHAKSVHHYQNNSSEKKEILEFMTQNNYTCIAEIDPGNANTKLIFS
jgi:FkbM family methyltransferase